MRSIGMDVHRSFAQVAILEDGLTAKSFRVDLEHDAVLAFGKSLQPDDEVVLEATGNTAAIVRLLTPFVARVVIANPMQVKAIAHARIAFGQPRQDDLLEYLQNLVGAGMDSSMLSDLQIRLAPSPFIASD